MGRRIPLLALTLALAATACSQSSAENVTYTDAAKLSQVSLPSNWHLYDYNELKELPNLPFVETFQGQNYPAVSSVGFDGGPVRDINNLTGSVAGAAYPVGSMSVRTVGDFERDLLSRATLSQIVVPYYAYTDPNEHVSEDFTFGDGWDGVRRLVSFVDDTNQLGVAYILSVTDNTENRVFSVVVGCSRQCFLDNQAQIEEVIGSWLVNKRS
jgi:hypothetical protein